MKVVIQRVSQAEVKINNHSQAKINHGLVVLLGITTTDTITDVQYLVKKIKNLRIFNNHEGKMDKSIVDVNGEIIVVSQFTLYANTKKGNRPSYMQAAPPATAIPLYEEFIRLLTQENLPIFTGVFGADMQVSLTNDGPVTIIIDTLLTDNNLS